MLFCMWKKKVNVTSKEEKLWNFHLFGFLFVKSGIIPNEHTIGFLC